MGKQEFTLGRDGFYGVYHPCPVGAGGHQSRSAMIYMLGPALDGVLVKMGLKWLHNQGVNVMVMAPTPEEKGFHSIPLERYGAAIKWLKQAGNDRIGITGGSATAMLALLVASYYSDITLTVAITPCDFVMEGYLRDNLDGTKERPADGESVATWQGKTLPYVPYAYRHPEYWNRVQAESKASKNMIATRQMFDLSEELHPLTEETFIKVERIAGRIVLVGAEDDCLWDTVKYIQRIVDRIRRSDSTCEVVTYTYSHGTHFMFPEGMLKAGLHCLSGIPVLLFKAGRENPGECKQNRIDLDKHLTDELNCWIEE